jgi:hypothetical protein
MKNNTSQDSQKASQGRGERRSTRPARTIAAAGKDAAELVEIIKLGVDTHQNSYSVARMFEGGNPQPSQNMTPEAFLKFAQKQKKLARRVVVAYEAGPFGFHLHRQLVALGIECLVVVAQDWMSGIRKPRPTRSTPGRSC